MICTTCNSTNGCYGEYEDYSWDWELHHYTTWYCFDCKGQINQYDDGFVWPDEE